MHPTPSHPVPSHTNLSEAAHPHPKIPKIPPRPDPLKQDYDSMSMNSQKPYSSINTIILTNLWALCDAKNNGVWPQASSTLANAPDASNTAAQSKWPKYAAWWSGVLPNLIKKGAVKYHCWPWIGPEWRNVSELMQHNVREKDDTKM